MDDLDHFSAKRLFLNPIEGEMSIHKFLLISVFKWFKQNSSTCNSHYYYYCIHRIDNMKVNISTFI